MYNLMRGFKILGGGTDDMKCLFVTIALVLIASALFFPAGAEGKESESDFSRGSVRLSYFKDVEMDFQLLRSLGADAAGGGAAGEILEAARNIEDGSPSSWSAAFLSLAERLEADGNARLERGHQVSARESLLRAASYYRAAEYYGDPSSATTAQWGMRCRDVFLRAMGLSPWKTESVLIPFGRDKDFLPGYFISPSRGSGRRKTLLAQSGYDGTAEEMYFSVGKAALERGYNVLLFDGPGQTGKRRFHPDSTFVPDTAPALRAVVNYALSRPDVHSGKIALYGASFGGYFALSGAVGEGRLGAVIANSPLLDAQEYFFASMGPQFVAMFQKEDLTVEEIRAIPEKDLPEKYRLSLLNLCIRYGKPSVKGVLDGLRDFRLRDDQVRSLSMPALGMISEGEGAVPLSQAKRFAELAPRASLHIFEEESGANIHCQLDNMPLSWAVALDWLDEQFR
jgi:pimeloyl-ACP methyl ester carboxylesterase